MVGFRPQRPRPVQPEGVYSNGHFMHAATSQVGNIVRIQTASGNVWEGWYESYLSFVNKQCYNL